MAEQDSEENVEIDINLDLSDLEGAEAKLQKLEKNLDKIDGEHDVRGEDLMTDAFIQANTNFQTLKAFLDASGIKSQEELGTEAFDKFIDGNTRFADWQTMFKTAGADWAKRQLEL